MYRDIGTEASCSFLKFLHETSAPRHRFRDVGAELPVHRVVTCRMNKATTHTHYLRDSPAVLRSQLSDPISVTSFTRRRRFLFERSMTSRPARRYMSLKAVYLRLKSALFPCLTYRESLYPAGTLPVGKAQEPLLPEQEPLLR